MIRHLRAFAWFRWRVLMNTLERTGRRDRLQRFSLAVESLGPILVLLTMVPAAIGLAGAGVVAGFALGRGGNVELVTSVVLRFAALTVLGITAITPLFSSVGRRPEDLMRLLLMPISRSTLFASEFIAGLTEPWLAISVPMFLLVPVGAAVSGRPVVALLTLGAALAFVTALLGLAMLSSALIQLLVRNRRRAELLAVIAVFLPLLLSLPAMLHSEDIEEDHRAQRARGERVARPAPPLTPPAQGWLVLVPSELYAAAATRAPQAPAAAGLALGGLVAAAAGLSGLSWFAYRRMLTNPMAGSSRETRAQNPIWNRRIPGLTRAASAVAMAEVRLALRTPRGRITVITPVIVMLVFAVPMLAGREGFSFGAGTVGSSLGLSVMVGVFGILALAPLALNQFAVDGAGLTAQLLAPITDRELLSGKAVGLAIIGGLPIATGLAVAAAIFPPPPLSLWIALVVGTVAAFLVLTPLWAFISAVFPRAATLNSIRSSASNPHPAANFIGFAATLGVAAPPAGLAALAIGVLDRPDLVLPLVGLWAAAAFVVNRALFRPATSAFARRRENLGLVAQGR